MKTFMLFLFLIIFFGINNLKAQSFPLSGATWIFKSDHPFGMDEFALKFEYEEDSIIQEGVIKKIKVTTKTVNPGWLPDSTTLINENQQHFLYAGDTIWNTNDSLSPVAIFSVQVGDSMYTPYHSSLSPLYPLIMDSVNTCSEEEISLFFQKGIVVETGDETENTITYRYYKLKFLNELGDTIIRKFSERTILTEGYWHYNNVLYGDCSSTDFPTYSFMCYKDDFSSSSICNGVDWFEWFEHLNVEKNKPILDFDVYPNPAADVVTIDIAHNEKSELLIYKLDGTLIRKETLLSNRNVVSIRDLNTGVYFFEINTDKGTAVKKMIKN